MFKAIDNYFGWVGKGGFKRLFLGLFLPIIVVVIAVASIGGTKKKDTSAPADAAAAAVAPAEATPKPTPDPSKVSNSQAFEACDVAKKFVKDNLKAPATAKFGDCLKDFGYTRNGDDWLVSGHVDAQNGFGALLRNVFSLHMTNQGGGRYTLTDIKLQPQ